MPDVITIGKRFITLDQIAFVEPFNPARNPNFKPSKTFKARLVLLNREIVLSEEEPSAFAAAHGMRFLAGEDIGINPTLAFRIETFAPTDDFKPGKPFQTRLKWRDADGKEQSKLLLAKPEVLIELIGGKDNSGAAPKGPARRANGRRFPRRHAGKSAPAHS
jgi:hypothetical protein